MCGDHMFQNSILDLHGARSDPEFGLLTKSQRAHGAGTHPRGQTEFRQSMSSAYPLGVMSLDRWVDAIQRIDSPEYIKILY